MPLMFNPKSPEEILRSMLNRLLIQHPDADLSPGTIAHSILKLSSEEIGEFYEVLSAQVAMSLLSESEGRHLDLLGRLFGCERLATEPTFASSDDYILSLPSGITADDYGGILIVPAGTLITTDPNLGELIRYRTLQDAVFQGDTTSLLVPIEAVEAGPDSNVPSNALSDINYTGAVVFGTNPVSIDNGELAESDDNYRYRISQQILVLESANLTAVRMAAITVPGVRDVIIRRYVKGPGSFLIYVVASDFDDESPVISRVREAVDAVSGGGDMVMVLTPEAKQVRIGLLLEFRDREQQFVDQASKLGAIAAARSYFNGLMPGATLNIDDLTDAVELALPTVRRVSISQIEIDGRTALLKDHTLYWDQRWQFLGADVA